jgi:hypothetical protein
VGSVPRDKRPSEFGGVPGRIQPPPHEPTTDETLSQVYATDPAALPESEQFVPETRKVR